MQAVNAFAVMINRKSCIFAAIGQPCGESKVIAPENKAKYLRQFGGGCLAVFNRLRTLRDRLEEIHQIEFAPPSVAGVLAISREIGTRSTNFVFLSKQGLTFFKA